MSISVIIPAYNEERTVGSIVRAALAARPLVTQVIVVDDGSGDGTGAEARRAGAEVLACAHNRGKAEALLRGAENAGQDTLMFLDADLLGLKPEHVRALALPVVEGRAHMTIGVFRNGRPATDLAQRLAPQLSGQRCLTKAMFADTRPLLGPGYGVEKALNLYARRHGLTVTHVPLVGVSHVMKEEKRGLWRGIEARVRMYLDLWRA
ncbi:MAG: glycosyltransferase family 2 protein [Clostridia bacterium]|nr:glycosyltransferase family 2 protein [Clostridia bacterium]MDH7572384.1 glycosyltransferase family 2 protein [Clostridia bacterium]